MRNNIYGEEITNRVELVTKAVNQQPFYGVRFYLKSHPDLHHSIGDNDESAVTFWVPWTKEKGHNFKLLSDCFLVAYAEIEALMNKVKK